MKIEELELKCQGSSIKAPVGQEKVHKNKTLAKQLFHLTDGNAWRMFLIRDIRKVCLEDFLRKNSYFYISKVP